LIQDKVWKLEDRKLITGVDGVREEYTKCKQVYFLSKGKEAEGMHN